MGYNQFKIGLTKTLFSGDFGGYLGLLVGASVITVFELLDLVIYNGAVKLRKRFPARKTEDQPQNYNVRL